MLLDGAKVAAGRRAALADDAEASPMLGVIVATDDPATRSYVGRKCKAAEEIGWRVRLEELPRDARLAEIVRACEDMNDDPEVTGYIVQLPLPEGIDEQEVLCHIDPDKDADGLAPVSLGRLASGAETTVPATARGVKELLSAYDVDLLGRHVTVIGKGLLAGLPTSLVMSREGATVTVCDEHTRDLAELTRRADIIVSAVGEPGLVTADMVGPGAIVVDVGISKVDGHLAGDAEDAVSANAAAVSPVPGGVGPMTVVSLLENLRDLDRRRARRGRNRVAPRRRALAGGFALNLLLSAAALRRFGTGEAGLRVATRVTGQAGMLAYLPFFTGRALRRLKSTARTRWLARHRETFLWAYAGGHVIHMPLIATLMRLHGHPQAGTPMRDVSVYGGSAGYAAVIGALLRSAAARRGRGPGRWWEGLAEWYVLVGPHAVPTVHGYAVKNRSLAVYGVPFALWLLAAGLRVAGGVAPLRSG